MSDMWWLKHDAWRRAELRAAGYELPEPAPAEDVLADPTNQLGMKFPEPYARGQTKTHRLIDLKLPNPGVVTIGLRAVLDGSNLAYTAADGVRAIFRISTGAHGAPDELREEFSVLANNLGSIQAPGTPQRRAFRRYLSVIGHKISVNVDLVFPDFAVVATPPGPPQSSVMAYVALGDSTLPIVAEPPGAAIDEPLFTRIANGGPGNPSIWNGDPRTLAMSIFNDSNERLRVLTVPSNPLVDPPTPLNIDATTWSFALNPGFYWESPPGMRVVTPLQLEWDGAGGGANITSYRSRRYSF